jgi:hypothetical protein
MRSSVKALPNELEQALPEHFAFAAEYTATE